MNEQQGLDPMFQENGSQWMEGGLASEPLNVYTAKTFGWMFLGLLVTFGTAIAFSAGGGLYYLLTMGMPAVFALAIAEIVDLSGLRPILTAGLIFLLVFWLISMFLPLSGFDRIICFVGLAVFMGLTAYDTQKIKQLHAAFEGDYEMSKKASIFAALQLYLDFINIFLYILRLLGRRSSSN